MDIGGSITANPCNVSVLGRGITYYEMFFCPEKHIEHGQGKKRRIVSLQNFTQQGIVNVGGPSARNVLGLVGQPPDILCLRGNLVDYTEHA